MPDFVVFGTIIAEIKALDGLTAGEEGQLLNYLKASGLAVGLLLNFGSARRLEWKRMIWTPAPVQGGHARHSLP